MRTLITVAALSFMTLPSHADTITVCASGCDYTSIQAAIDAATHGDVISLHDQFYEEGAEIDMRGKAITLKGLNMGAPGQVYTTIKGQNAHRILACRSGETNFTIIQDIKFSGGIGDGSGGGGLLIQGANPIIDNCYFESNKIGALQYGGGVLVDGGSPQFITPTFKDNGPIEGGQTLLITGGGIAILSGHVTMSGPCVTNNHAHAGGGMWVGPGASAHLLTHPYNVENQTVSIEFCNNMAYGIDSKIYTGLGAGGGIMNWGDLSIDGTSPSGHDPAENWIEQNLATASNEEGGLGGGIYHIGTNLWVKNVRFYANSATVTPSDQKGSGGGIYAVNRIANLVNVEIFNNYPNGIGGAQGQGTELQGEPPVVALEGCTIHGNSDEETDQQIDGLLVMHLGDNHISKHAPPSGCPSDLDGDGDVGPEDLALLLGSWGVCP